MKSLFENTLHIAHDGNLHINEVIGIAILVIVTVLAVLLIRDLRKKAAGRLPGRRKTIFSHHKNRYKTRIDKKRKY